MRDKFIDALNGALKDHFDYVPLDTTIKIADQLIAEGFGMVNGWENIAEVEGPCKVGDKVYVLYFNEDNGKTEIDEMTVSEVSGQRIWVGAHRDCDFPIDGIGKVIFLSPEEANAYVKSPEYLAERVNMVLHLNLSNEAKKELLVKTFESGQEYFEKDTERHIVLTDTNPEYIWGFDVLDKNKEFLYSTSALAVQLAIDILNGEIMPAALVQEKSVSELISKAEAQCLSSVSSRREIDREHGIQ